ncbi:ATP-binding cassette domain-containing protein [bacterium]|nr:ATP-binding cassette domain-containing protein [bacterium]
MKRVLNGIKMNNNDKRIKDAEEKIAMFNYITNHVIKLAKKLSLNYEEKNEEIVSNPILDVQNVQKYYSTNKKVLDQISFKVNAGEFFGIVGESGSGKSTLGKIIIRIINNSGGTILFDNKFISSKKLLKRTRK